MTSVSSATGALATLQTLALQSPASRASAVLSRSEAAPGTANPVANSAVAPGLFALADGASQALSAADAAGAAGQTVLGLLHQMRDTAGRAADPSATDADRRQLDQEFQSATSRVGATLASATINGTNLADGSTKTSLKVPLGGGATASLAPMDLSLGGPTLGLPADTSVATATAASSAFLTLGGAIGAASGALSTLQGQADRVDAHIGFVQQLGQALASPGDDGGDSARLLALQVSQQLSGQPGAISNTAPQSVLSLFRS